MLTVALRFVPPTSSALLCFTHNPNTHLGLPKQSCAKVGIVCSATATPLYVAAESLKFSRLYPLNQQDLPPQLLQNPKDGRKHWEVLSSPGVDLHAPRCDFTPAKLVTLLFTDLGVLTPAAVSDELIKLYQ